MLLRISHRMFSSVALTCSSEAKQPGEANLSATLKHLDTLEHHQAIFMCPNQEICEPDISNQVTHVLQTNESGSQPEHVRPYIFIFSQETCGS